MPNCMVYLYDVLWLNSVRALSAVQMTHCAMLDNLQLQRQLSPRVRYSQMNKDVLCTHMISREV